MLDDVIGYLACPYCGSPLRRAGGSLRCGAGHAFDIARHGYVSLLPPGASGARRGARGGAGDTAAMVRARAGFLAAGHFAALAGEIADAVRYPPGGAPGQPGGPGADGGGPAGVPGCVADVGAGTGYFLGAVLDRLPGRVGVALDISKFALRKAARAHPRAGAVGCDAWQRLPVADAAAASVLSVFAPRNAAELRRILHPGGRLVVVTPQPGHLAELIGPLGLLTVDERKDDRLAGKLDGHFEIVTRRPHVRRLSLDHQDAGALAAMGPSSWHVDAGTLAARVRALPCPVQVTVAVTLSVYRAARP